MRSVLDEISNDYVANRKAHRGEVDFSIGQGGNEGVVTTAASNRTLLLFGIEDLEDHAGIVGEAADDGEVHLDIIPHAAGFQIVQDRIEVLGEISWGLDRSLHFCEGEPQLFELRSACTVFVALEFVDDG